jgi:hypothetical protein
MYDNHGNWPYLSRLDRICLFKRTTGLHGEDTQTKAISSRDDVSKYRRKHQNTEHKKENNKTNYWKITLEINT